MGFKTTTSNIYWTNLELRGLLEDEDSCVHLERIKKHVALHPFHMTDLNAAFREILGASLNKYDVELKGLVLAYKNPKLLTPVGNSFNDTCFVHLDIEADFYIFRPQVGQSLKGFVNKKGTNHIGILLHKAFNVSVPKPDDEVDQEDWPGNCVEIGQEVRFTLDEIDYNTRLPYIRGSFIKEEYLQGCKLFNHQIAATWESELEKQSSYVNGTDVKKPFTIKTENKHIVFDSDSEVEVDPEDESEKKPSVKKLKIKSDNTEESVKPSTKRKRKSTLTSESDSEQLTQESGKEHKIKIKENLLLNNSINIESEVQHTSSKKHKRKIVEYTESIGNTENEKKQKSLINKLTQSVLPTCSSDIESNLPNSIEKKHKKKNKKDKIDNETDDDERKNKSKISLIDHSFDTSNDKESKEPLVKTSKKERRKVSECIDTEDEKEHKLTINKHLTQQSKINDPFEAESESESPKVKSKKRKRSFIETNIPNDSEDEKNYKQSLKKLSKQLSANDSEAAFEVSYSSPKKKKKKRENEAAVDTEDEKRHKSSLIKNLSQNTVMNEIDSDEFQASKPKKKKKIVDDDTLMDTEDERRYKSSLKELIQKNFKNDSQQNDTEFKIPKVKKSKKKRKSSQTETQADFDPSLIKIKVEPESETESTHSTNKNQER